MAESWVVNGVDLSSLAWRIESGDGLASTPPVRDMDVDIPDRHGVLAGNRMLFGPGQLVLNMWVQGLDPTTGLVPGGSTSVDEYYKRLDVLGRLFTAPTLTVVHTRPDGTARQAVGRLVSQVEFGREASDPVLGRFSAAIKIPAAFWQDVNAVSQTVSLASGATATLTGFAAATAPMSQLTLTFGPGANPTLQQPATGAFIAYDGIIGAGQQLTINTDTLELGYGSGSVWNPDETKVRFGGSRSFELRPETGGPTIRLVHTAGGSMSLTVAGRRAYLTA